MRNEKINSYNFLSTIEKKKSRTHKNAFMPRWSSTAYDVDSAVETEQGQTRTSAFSLSVRMRFSQKSVQKALIY